MLRFEAAQMGAGDFLLGADFELPGPGVTAVIGPSGSGKSTLLSAIAGFLPLQAGRILWNGTDLGPMRPAERPVSIVFQDGNLFPHLDVATNTGLGLHPSGRLNGVAREAVDAALDRVGLAGLGQRKPGELSGGQQSRAALARALLRARPVVLLDEPFAALGPALRREMLALAAEVFADATVLMVTHAPEDARGVADQTIFVEGGVAHAPAETSHLFANPPEALKDYL